MKIQPVTYSGQWRNRFTDLNAQTLTLRKHFSSFSSVVFQRKYVEVAINNFTMHLIISKWLRNQKFRQTRKIMRQRGRSKRRNCQRKCFHSFNKCNASSKLRSPQRSHKHIATNFLFEYMIFLKIICEKKSFS